MGCILSGAVGIVFSVSVSLFFGLLSFGVVRIAMLVVRCWFLFAFYPILWLIRDLLTISMLSVC